MIRITKESNTYYGIEIYLDREEIENIKEFTDGGSPVVLVNSLDDLHKLGIDPEEVEMVN